MLARHGTGREFAHATQDAQPGTVMDSYERTLIAVRSQEAQLDTVLRGRELILLHWVRVRSYCTGREFAQALTHVLAHSLITVNHE